MTGLEKILGQIRDEAQAEAEKVLAEARAQAGEIAAKAAAETEAECARIAAQAQRDRQDALRRAQSAADLNKRRALLAAKQQIIGEVIEKAHTTLLALPADQYFDTILRLAARYARPGESTVYFNAADLARLPANYAQALEQAAPEGAVLTISTEPRPIDGGFVLAGGGIEENCSFSALFSAGREAMQDQVQKLLFP